MKKKSLITTLALTGGLLSLGLCLTSCDLSQNNTTTQTPISETTPALPNPIDETTPSEIQETTPTDNTTTSNQEGTLKQKILNSNSENEIINILGEYSLEEIELALKDEEVQDKITLSDQFNNLQVILSSVNDTLKQISNNVASSKTTTEEDYNYLEFDVVKKYNYSFYASNLENANVHIQNGIMYYYGTSSGSGTSGTSIGFNSSTSTSKGTSSSTGTSSSDSLGGSAGVGFIGSASGNYNHNWGSSTGTSVSDSSSNSFSQGSSSGVSVSGSVSESSGFSSNFKPTTLHFYNISDVDISTYSYEDISRIYKIVKSALVNDDNKLTLQSFNFDKIQLIESDKTYIKKIYSENSEGRNSSVGTSSGSSQSFSQGTSSSDFIGWDSSSNTGTSTSDSTSNSFSQGSGSSTSTSGYNEGESSSSTSVYSYYSIYEMQGTNDLTLHFKLEFNDNVSLEDMLNLININSSSFTVNLTNIYYK